MGLTDVAALDYADRGVRVNVVAPGPILIHHLEQAGAEVPRLAGQSVPMNRVGTTSVVADVVRWLCSSRSSFVTGVTVPSMAVSWPEPSHSPGCPGMAKASHRPALQLPPDHRSDKEART
jgi:NAD(P)-dependent dehydrogenase (short-subunit alcohol dehydrogenase family)